MNELIPIINTDETPKVSGRDLHMFLEVGTEYMKWVERYFAPYGFVEGVDFSSKLTKTSEGGRPSTDHILSVDMAKELSMLQRTERGSEARKYFIQLEKEWNSPEKVMARALVMADKQIKSLTLTNKQQALEIAQKDQLIGEMQSKVNYVDVILKCKDLITIRQIAADYGMTPHKMNETLHKLGVIYKQSDQWFVYSNYLSQGYTKSEIVSFTRRDGSQGYKPHTKWTQKGHLFLYDFLKKRGIVPLIEQEG